jgi:hypothetical protein
MSQQENPRIWTSHLSTFCLSDVVLEANATSINADKSIFLYSHPWIPAGFVTIATRSPYLTLSTLAKYGFLTRHSYVFTKEDSDQAQIEALNFDYNVAPGK